MLEIQEAKSVEPIKKPSAVSPAGNDTTFSSQIKTLDTANDPDSVTAFPIKHQKIQLPNFTIEQVKLTKTQQACLDRMQSFEEIYNTEMHDMQATELYRQKMNELYREQEVKELKLLQEKQEEVKDNKFVSNIFSALSFCVTFATGATIAASGNPWAGGILMLGAITSVAAQVSELKESKYAIHLQTLSLVLSVASLACGPLALQQTELQKKIASLTIICQSLLGIHRGYRKLEVNKQEKHLFLLAEQKNRYKIGLDKMLKTLKEITEPISDIIETNAKATSSLISMMNKINSDQRA